MAELLNDLKDKEGKTIWLLGGSALVGEALKHDLLDELVVSVHPFVLGDGVPLFPSGLPKTQFQFHQIGTVHHWPRAADLPQTSLIRNMDSYSCSR